MNIRLKKSLPNHDDINICALHWSFVGKKANPQWLWVALDAQTRQVIAFYVGDRSRKSARKLWHKIPAVYREQAQFYTDGHAAYQGVIPQPQHRVITKKARQTNHVERFNCTLRQRVSRLVRSALSFSKKLDNHIGAIKFFYRVGGGRCRPERLLPAYTPL